jgi:hypothetical protein
MSAIALASLALEGISATAPVGNSDADQNGRSNAQKHHGNLIIGNHVRLQ